MNDTIVVLIGIGNYSNGLLPLPSAFDNVSALSKAFKNSGYTNVKQFINQPDYQNLLIGIRKELKNSKIKNVIFYYSGHGVISDDDILYLTVANSTEENYEIDSFSIDVLCKCFEQKNVLLILDCCFSEKAFDDIKLNNFVAISSTSKIEKSKYPTNKEFSTFSHELIDVIRHGIDDNSKEFLNPKDVFLELKERLGKKNEPTPKILGTEFSENFQFVRNNFGQSPKHEQGLISLSNTEFINENINKNLLNASLIDSVSPKTISEIFVAPRIFDKPEKKHNAILTLNVEEIKLKEKSEKINVESLLKSNTSFLIFGEKEAGKTTLLNYLFSCLLSEPTVYEFNTPLYANFLQIDINKRGSIENELRNSVGVSNNQLQKLLTSNKIVIFVDNLDISNEKEIRFFNEFAQKHRNIKYIITATETSGGSLIGNEDSINISLGIEFKKYYLHPFSRNEIFRFVENWFSKSSKQPDELKELKSKLYNVILLAQIPCTPINICFLLCILEKSQDLNKILNRTNLVEEFVQTMLEKFPSRSTERNSIRITKVFNTEIDYRNKEHYLAFIAGNMVRQKKFQFERDNFIVETSKYFKSYIGLPKFPSNDLITYFIEKGIFDEKDGKIFFKHRCFLEYFIAKQMSEDNDFFYFILDEKRYVNFINEIDYFTSMHRNNHEIVENIHKKASIIFEKFTLKHSIDFNSYEKVSSEFEDVFTSEEFLIRTLSTNQKDIIIKSEENSQLDRFLDKIPENQEISKSQRHNSESDYLPLNILILLSTVIRNSELIPIEKRYPLIEDVFEYWAIYMLYTINVQDESKIKDSYFKIVLAQEEKGKVDPKKIREQFNKNKEEIAEMTKLFVPILFQSIIKETLGSDKLESTYLKLLINNKQFPVKLNVSFLYSDLKLPNYLQTLRKVFEEAPKNKYVTKLFYVKLVFLYMMKESKEKDTDKLLDFIVDIYVDYIAKIKVQGKRERSIYKNQIVQKFEKERLKNKMPSI